MLPPRCKTCNKILLTIVNDYENKYYLIEDNPKLTKQEKEEQKIELFKKLKLDRQCCKSKILTYVDLIRVIV